MLNPIDVILLAGFGFSFDFVNACEGAEQKKKGPPLPRECQSCQTERRPRKRTMIQTAVNQSNAFNGCG